jgi:hypothetical protein
MNALLFYSEPVMDGPKKGEKQCFGVCKKCEFLIQQAFKSSAVIEY